MGDWTYADGIAKDQTEHWQSDPRAIVYFPLISQWETILQTV